MSVTERGRKLDPLRSREFIYQRLQEKISGHLEAIICQNLKKISYLIISDKKFGWHRFRQAEELKMKHKKRFCDHCYLYWVPVHTHSSPDGI